MHYLGISGMPRRIPDYPDAFSEWNSVCTWGAFTSILATIFFIFGLIINLLPPYSRFKLVFNKYSYAVVFRITNIFKIKMKYFRRYCISKLPSVHAALSRHSRKFNKLISKAGFTTPPHFRIRLFKKAGLSDLNNFESLKCH
jgi:heme/copper-type cytochrome/quinol oxidase subunit 1